MTVPPDALDELVPPEPASNGGSAHPKQRRDLRDNTLFRVAALVAVLGAAFLSTKSCAKSGGVSQAQAMTLARKEIDFTPDQENIRYVQRGVPPVGYWAVSLSSHKPDGTLKRVAVLLVSADTGQVSTP